MVMEKLMTAEEILEAIQPMSNEERWKWLDKMFVSKRQRPSPGAENSLLFYHPEPRSFHFDA